MTLGAPDDYELGRLVVRVEVAAASEGLVPRLVRRSSTMVTLTLGRGAVHLQGTDDPLAGRSCDTGRAVSGRPDSW